MLMIPREGGTMVRCYVDLGEVPLGEKTIRSTTVEQMTARANAILRPYSIDVRSVAWSSVYEVGQRLTDFFDDVPIESAGERLPRVFIAGDACHTHSAKAGQGMNVSMQDDFDLGWKFVTVLSGRADPTLLQTYSAERQAVAQDLIDFDRFWSGFIAQPMADPANPQAGGVTADQMRAEFESQGRYTAGLATRYEASRLAGSGENQSLATGFEVGARFHSAPVTRIADGRRMELGHVHQAGARWRHYAFGDESGDALRELAAWLSTDPASPLRRFTRDSDDLDAVLDVHGIFQGDHHDIEVTGLPEALLPPTGPFALQDWEKAWAAGADDIVTARGIDRSGAIVLVRPDQYVATGWPLTARGEIGNFLAGVLTEPAR